MHDLAGEKLNESTATDVRQLCNTLLNCYLIQLLETGFLHADPHPGNLLRTPDGRICILDFGLMTSISPARSISLVEYIAHLSVGDWESVARDLGNLGFTKPGQAVRRKGRACCTCALGDTMCCEGLLPALEAWPCERCCTLLVCAWHARNASSTRGW